jgi:benzoate transport|tara:strand:- start:1429 stop:2721 length:1293 start_codon:yes stop_codon:yes gene_type:complete
MNNNPRKILNDSPMGIRQILVVGICVLLTALDGFDVLSISFASPGIAKDWGIDRAALGVVLSMELIGMALGSIFLGNMADRVGRRPIIIFCLLVMATGMFMAGSAQSVNSLLIHRFYTGLAIGGMLASTNAMVAEFSNSKRRNLSVILMAAGYPLGVIIGGVFAVNLLQDNSWRSIFVFGGTATLCFLPFVYWLLPESVAYLNSRRPSNAINRINATLKILGHAQIAQLPEVGTQQKTSISELFKPSLIRSTVLLTFAYFMHIMTFYFILKWVPKIVVDMGFSPSLAGSVLVWANVGGLLGCITLGLLSNRFQIKTLLVFIFLGSSLMVMLFGSEQQSLTQLSVVVAVAGFFTNAGVVGLYALFAQYFPDALRASGSGFAIGVGRGGAAISPILAGLLFAAGYGLQSISVLMALGSALAAITILFLVTKR